MQQYTPIRHGTWDESDLKLCDQEKNVTEEQSDWKNYWCRRLCCFCTVVLCCVVLLLLGLFMYIMIVGSIDLRPSDLSMATAFAFIPFQASASASTFESPEVSDEFIRSLGGMGQCGHSAVNVTFRDVQYQKLTRRRRRSILDTTEYTVSANVIYHIFKEENTSLTNILDHILNKTRMDSYLIRDFGNNAVVMDVSHSMITANYDMVCYIKVNGQKDTIKTFLQNSIVEHKVKNAIQTMAESIVLVNNITLKQIWFVNKPKYIGWSMTLDQNIKNDTSLSQVLCSVYNRVQQHMISIADYASGVTRIEKDTFTCCRVETAEFDIPIHDNTKAWCINHGVEGNGRC